MQYNIVKSILELSLKFLTKIFPTKTIRFKILLNKLSDNYLNKKIKNKNFSFSVENHHCLKRYNTILSKEKGTIEWLDKIGKNEILWDIGANIGIYSLYAAKIKNAEVYSFEPLINSAKVLRKNIEINNLQKKINLFPIGLGEQNGNLKMFYSSNHAASSQHALKSNKKDKFENVLFFQPDELVKKKNIKMPNFVKIDTDGNELNILKYSKKILKSKSLKSLCIENEFGKYEKLTKDKIVNFLKGYKFFLTNIDVYIAGYNMFFDRKKF